MTTATTGQPGPLSSDHINYLILRYLQEAGHEASATAFYRDWRRPAEYRDPEDLPFAPSVRRHELVSVLQEGLHHDELIARVRKGERRFNFTTNGAGVGSRPGSRPGTATAGKGKGRMEQMRRATEDFPTPPPKRQRKSEERQTNGASAAERMEVDAASPSADDAEDDAEGASPAVQTPEAEIVEVPERYDSMDVAVQTEGKTGPKTSTIYWRVNRPDATILHNAFSPIKGSRALFAAGEGFSQFYDLPGDVDSGVDKIASLEDAGTGTGSYVTACAWHPEGHSLAFAVDQVRELGVASKSVRKQVIRIHNAKTLRTTEYHSPPLLEPQGIIMALRYSLSGTHLLAVRTNGARSTVELWSQDNPHSIAWSIFDRQILDATWTEDLTFWVCGEDGFVRHFKLLSDQSNGITTHTSESARLHGLEMVQNVMLDEDSEHLTLDKIRVPVSGQGRGRKGDIFVAAASESGRLVHAARVGDGMMATGSLALESRITGVAFCPGGDRAAENAELGRHLLVVAREDGRFTVYDFLGQTSSLEAKLSLYLADSSPALALAWSPQGSCLAVAGVDVVQIWDTQSLLQQASSRQLSKADAIVTWRRDKHTLRNGERNGDDAGNEQPSPEPTLSWSADGENLALGVGREVAVIRFRPPLHGGTVSQVNGHVVDV